MKNLFRLFRTKSLAALVCLLALSILTVSCDEDDPPRIALSAQELTFGFEAAAQTVRVETDGAWSARIVPAEAAAWCSLSLTGSDRAESVSVFVDANLPAGDRTAERHATIVFAIDGRGGNTSTTLHVTQGIMPERN
ncbi:BACON domain-containing protein [Alistipes sp.]|uniref:BACON domain-containing protein n=1 Tax=Alistipes sp. TaxID=1872444 RepID=UPI003AF13E87